jgi:hypothetical protein
MGEVMAERRMSPKGFLAKTNTRAANSAAGFLVAHREWLMTGEVSQVTSPILAKLDMGELLPTPALKAIAVAVMGHIIATDRAKAEDAMEEQGKTGTTKPWLATIYDSKDVICTRTLEDGEIEDLVKGFDHSSEADRWVDRRLFDGASDWYGVVEGMGTHVRVERADAIARILKKPKGPAIHQRGKSTKTLSFGVHVKQSRASFSRG